MPIVLGRTDSYVVAQEPQAAEYTERCGHVSSRGRRIGALLLSQPELPPAAAGSLHLVPPLLRRGGDRDQGATWLHVAHCIWCKTHPLQSSHLLTPSWPIADTNTSHHHFPGPAAALDTGLC